MSEILDEMERNAAYDEVLDIKNFVNNMIVQAELGARFMDKKDLADFVIGIEEHISDYLYNQFHDSCEKSGEDFTKYPKSKYMAEWLIEVTAK